MFYTLGGITDMLDGFIARKTSTESKAGAKLDSIADVIFLIVCIIKILPAIDLPEWILIWIGVIALIKSVSIILGFIYSRSIIMLHTVLNKTAGLLLFVLPFTFSFLDMKYASVIVCFVATIAAVADFEKPLCM